MDLPPKQDVARALLLSGSVFIHMDPRHEGVMVPRWLQRQPQLVLQVGLDMTIPIPDLRVDEHGVYGTLSFNRSPFTCLVPWDAIFALAGEDGRGMVWPESMPSEIRSEIEREAGRQAPVALVRDEDEAGDEGDDEAFEGAGPDVIPLRPARKLAPRDGAAQPGPKPVPSADDREDSASSEAAPTNGKGRALPPYLRVIK